MDTHTRDFVPALGRPELTNSYDRVIAVMTRERRWRAQLLALVDPKPGDTILDVGCGTGTFAIMLKTACPTALVVGVDPDETVLGLARDKAAAARAEVEWRSGMGDELSSLLPKGSADKAVSSLVLHQCPMDMKRAILGSIFDALKPGGHLFIADYGEQRTLLMRLLFRQVQQLDGFENTQPNADGVLPGLIEAAGFVDVREVRSIATPTGSISLLTAGKPCSASKP
jgi:ubiquinone/menaquinone biosynthesis C-methylase UbiE